MRQNRQKILNDPVYGFISFPKTIIYDIIEHPYFQRLRRIKQLGLTEMVYPGAIHTRFHHAIGAMHLMQQTLDTLRQKGTEISHQEYEACLLAILLHDIGHGPFSHTLEYSFFEEINHEHITLMVMRQLNQEFRGQLDLAIQIFESTYNRKFFHQLVSSQLDMDRLDYLKRDSYYTGVVEGSVATERIISMLQVVDDELVVEEKGIYSIESFLSARRLMYWQVYLHKTTIAAETTLRNCLARAKYLVQEGTLDPEHATVEFLLKNKLTKASIEQYSNIINEFLRLDDIDILSCLKKWYDAEDLVLRTLSRMLLDRKLFRTSISNQPFMEDCVSNTIMEISRAYQCSNEEASYLCASGRLSNSAYLGGGSSIRILLKSGKILDIAMAADLPNVKAMRKIVEKYYLCKPKKLNLQQ